MKFLLKVLATVLLLTWVVSRLDVGQLRGALLEQSPAWLALGVLLSASFVATRIARWYLLTASNGVTAPFGEVARVMLLSLLLGIVTPGRVGEATSVAPFGPVQRSRALLLYLYDRVGELCVVMLLAVPGCVIFFGNTGVILAALAVVAVLSGVAVLESAKLRLLISRVFFLNRIDKVRQVLATDLHVPPAYWLVCIVAYLQAYLLIAAFILGAQAVADWRMVLLLPVVTLSNVISVTVGGLGIREGLAAAVLPLADVGAESAAAAFFLSFFFTRLAAGLVGLTWTALVAARGRSTTVDADAER